MGIERAITWLAGIVALVVALLPPAVYFTVAYNSQSAVVRTEADMLGHAISQQIATRPDLWMYEEHRLEGFLATYGGSGAAESRRIVDMEGNVLSRLEVHLPAPRIVHAHPLLDSGRPVGYLEIRQSYSPLVVKTVMVGLIGGFLGYLIFFVLRGLPLKAMRRALDLLAREKERAQVTLQSIGDGVIATDMAGRIVLINRAGARMTGWGAEEAVGRKIGEVYSPRGRDGEAVEDPLQRPLPEAGEATETRRHTLSARDGGELLVEDSVAGILREDGTPEGAVLVFRDVTERVRTERELQKARKLESLGILAGGIAHDFNNFLAGIIGNISLAKFTVDAENKAYRRLEEAERASMRAKDLAGKLLTFSKGGAPIRHLCAVEPIVTDSANLAVRGSCVRCDIEIPAPLWPAEIDGGQIGQVVNNLCINAVQAMPDGGVLSIRAENVVMGEGTAPHVRQGDYVRISVTDNGPGIPPEIQARIFDPYFTTKLKGSGLGLTTCYNIMKAHDGNIFVESGPGAGTTFRLYIPARRNEPVPEEEASDETLVTGTGRILVMDDEEVLRDVVGGMLEHLGYEPAYAREGAEALDMYAKAKWQGRPFAAVITDLTVPGGMGGREVIRKLLLFDPRARVIVSSGYSADPVMANYRKYGFRGIVAKPYRIHELARVVAAAILE